MDAKAFVGHLDVIQEQYRPVLGADVAAAIRGDKELPPRPLWITFDDAHPGVIERALPQLRERGVPATLFVCPGVIDTDQPYWWQILDAALALGHAVDFGGRPWTDRSIVTRLKQVPDPLRRATVRKVAEGLASADQSVRVRQTSTEALRGWRDAGLEIGNHTWDHPCLDACEPAEQHRQIVTAHDWLRDTLGIAPYLFAYPNGNRTAPSRRILDEKGYTVHALFDHSLARPSGPEVSRLRLDADAPLARLRAVTSGAHPAAYAALRRLQTTRGRMGASQ